MLSAAHWFVPLNLHTRAPPYHIIFLHALSPCTNQHLCPVFLFSSPSAVVVRGGRKTLVTILLSISLPLYFRLFPFTTRILPVYPAPHHARTRTHRKLDNLSLTLGGYRRSSSRLSVRACVGGWVGCGLPKALSISLSLSALTGIEEGLIQLREIETHNWKNNKYTRL